MISHVQDELTPISYWNLAIFVTTATTMDLAKFWMTLWLGDPQNPQFCENSGTYLKHELSYCDFCVEISKFSLPWQQGLVWHKYLSHISVKSVDPENPVWRKNVDDISYTSWVMADFLTTFTSFCYHSNKGGSSENWNDSMWSANPQNPQLVQNSRTYLECELSRCDLCVEISKFSLPWQQGLVWHKSHLHS